MYRGILRRVVANVITPGVKWMVLLGLLMGLFFWKILLTDQFSLVLEWETANQAYAWYHFATATIRQRVLPLWDPYTFAGHSFVGEMQTGLFYPLKLIFYLWPLDAAGLLSLRLYHVSYVMAHLLGAGFMFFLAQEVGLCSFAAVVAALVFSLGGFVGNVIWPNILDSAIWLPLMLLCLWRALRHEPPGRSILYACLTGLCLGMVILAGSLHVAIMDVMALVSAAVYLSLQRPQALCGAPPGWFSLGRGALILGVTGCVAGAAGAIQLLPSVEYSGLALRSIGDMPPLPATQKIPYALLSDTYRLLPHALLTFVFRGVSVGDAEVSNYLGILPLLCAIVGVWQQWGQPWVRYCVGLAGMAFFYSLGSFSWLHGVLYALVPFLDMAREAGRFIYLTHVAMALLAGFGVQTLFAAGALAPAWLGDLSRVLRWTVVVVVLVLGIPALYETPAVSEWMYVSLLFLLAAYGFFVYLQRGARRSTAQILLVGLVLCDLYAFHWSIRNILQEQRHGADHLEQLRGLREVAHFLKAQPGLFRVHMALDAAPNIGDLFGVQTLGGAGVTVLADYFRYRQVPRSGQLLNVRYIVNTAEDSAEEPVYRHGPWRVYETPFSCPRAWVVHEVVAEKSPEDVFRRIMAADFDPLAVAVVETPLALGISSTAAVPAEVTFDQYRADRVQLTVKAQSAGLLVLSEIAYPGWQARVNEAPSTMYKVNGLLRGVLVPSGNSHVVFWYAPRSVFVGAGLTCIAFVGTLALAAMLAIYRR